jgi:2-polyprenyl-6-methoxyphenol hydroxylase-like FAD-dependent oxidoreductase
MTRSGDFTVAIVGTGIGGTELAGYLGVNGRRVRVHDVRPEAIGGIRERGGLDVSGIASGFAPIECATTDLAEAVEGRGPDRRHHRSTTTTTPSRRRWRRCCTTARSSA